MKAPVDGRDRACPPCDATGRLLTFEPLDDMAVIVEQPCPTCDATGWITEEQLKAYWRSFYRARANATTGMSDWDALVPTAPTALPGWRSMPSCPHSHGCSITGHDCPSTSPSPERRP